MKKILQMVLLLHGRYRIIEPRAEHTSGDKKMSHVRKHYQTLTQSFITKTSLPSTITTSITL